MRIDDLLREGWAQISVPDERAAFARFRSRASARRRPRILMAAAVLVALTLLAAPAIGSNALERVSSLLRGEPPEEVIRNLEHLDRGAPAGMEQRPIVRATRKVYEGWNEVGAVRIWLTPTKNGGVCTSFEAPNERGRTTQLSGGCSRAHPIRPIEVGGLGPGTDPGIGYLQGRVASSIVALELEYENGAREAVQLQNGFFVVTVSPTRMVRGADTPKTLIGRDAEEDVVAREDVTNFYRHSASLNSERPPVAVIQEERPLVSVPVGGVTATIHVSPSRIGGTCGRVEVGATTWQWNCARREQLPNPIRWSLVRVPEGVVVSGIVRPGVTVRLEYQDGLVERPALHDGRFLFSLPRDRWVPGRRLAAIVGLEGAAELMRFPMAVRGDAFYHGPVDRLPRLLVWAPSHPDWPVAALLELETERAGTAVWELRRQDRRHWAETLRIGGRVIGGGELEWFPDGRERPVSLEWVPVLSQDGNRDAFLFKGELRVGTRVRVVYRDGSREEVEVVRPKARLGPNTAVFLYEVTEERRVKRLLRWEALDETGRVVATVPTPPVG